MCSSACERAGSAQIAFSTVVAALAQSKLAAWALHAGTARQAARRRAARMREAGAFAAALQPTVRGWQSGCAGCPPQASRHSTYACRRSRGADTSPRPCPLRLGSCDGRGYELIASQTQSTFCRRLLHGYRQAVGGGATGPLGPAPTVIRWLPPRGMAPTQAWALSFGPASGSVLPVISGLPSAARATVASGL